MKCDDCNNEAKVKGRCKICYVRDYRKNNKEKIAKVVKKKVERTKKQINAYHCKYQKGAGREKYLIRLKTYKRLRKDIIEDRKVCEECGSNKDLQIHHLEYKFDKEYLMLLCRKCHTKIHNSS